MQSVVSNFKLAGVKQLLAAPENTFFRNVKKMLRQHMIADTETTTSTFEIKSLVATIHSQDFPLLHDGKDNGMFFRKQWGCTIFRGDAKTPLTLLPEEIGLAKKISPTAVCLSMSRDTMDACGICLGDLDINDDADIKLTISLMSHRSMQQFLQEVSSMKAATVLT